jgi:hypothetical protein
MARKTALWTPLAAWEAKDWATLPDAVAWVEGCVGGKLWPAMETVIRALQQQLDAGTKTLRASARLYPAQGAPELVALTRAFWRRFRISGISVTHSGSGGAVYQVRLCDGVEDKTLRCPEDWRIYLHVVDLDRLYPRTQTIASEPPRAPVDHKKAVAKTSKNLSGPPQSVYRHEWFKICAEIARRCIDDRGRVSVPKNVRQFVGNLEPWCEEHLEKVPAESALREAASTIFEALRSRQK